VKLGEKQSGVGKNKECTVHAGGSMFRPGNSFGKKKKILTEKGKTRSEEKNQGFFMGTIRTFD